MKPIPASLIAIAISWALLVIGMMIGQLVTSGTTADVGSVALWVGAFALIGWAVAVLPLVAKFGRRKVLAELRWSWLSWSIVATAVFAVLLTPLIGRDAFVIIRYPALMGCITGILFALLTRRRDDKSA